MDPETGECVFGQKIQQVPLVQEAIQAVSQGTFQPNREKDELTYALQNPEHPGRTRGKGVVAWKYGFRDYIDTYRSRDRRKNEERLHLRRLEEQLLSQDERMIDEVRRQVALAMSQQQQQAAPAEPTVNVAGPLNVKATAPPRASLAIRESPLLIRRPSSTIQWMRSPSGHLVRFKLAVRT